MYTKLFLDIGPIVGQIVKSLSIVKQLTWLKYGYVSPSRVCLSRLREGNVGLTRCELLATPAKYSMAIPH